jgi:PAS domain-containing protein
MARALGGETSQNELTTIRCFDGTTRSVLSSACPLRSLSGQVSLGQVVGVAVVIQDVTEHKRIELDIEQRIIKLISSEIETEPMARG